MAGTSDRRDCCDASRAIRRHRSTRFIAACARCLSVLLAITGTIAATPSSVAFSIAHSMWSNLKIDITSVTGIAGAESTSASRLNLTSELPPAPPSENPVTTAWNTRPPATTSASTPSCTRSTRIRCSACAPSKLAVASSHLSVIHRRRVIACVHAPFVDTQKHFGGRFCVPRSVAFWLDDPLTSFSRSSSRPSLRVPSWLLS